MKKLLKQILSWWNKLKSGSMNDLLNSLLKALEKMSDNDISDVALKDNRLHFKYLGGKFQIIKSIHSKDRVGLLKVYHETPFLGEKSLILLDDFFIKVNNIRGFTPIRIKNHLEVNTVFGMTIDNEGMFQTDATNLAKVFIGQLQAKMQKDDFEIYLI